MKTQAQLKHLAQLEEFNAQVNKLVAIIEAELANHGINGLVSSETIDRLEGFLLSNNI